MERHMRRGEPREGGFTLPGLLVAVTVMLLGLQSAAFVWSQQEQRERERELLRVGGLYAEAIERYRDMSPGSVKTYPAQLQELLLDTRFVGTVRHLRRLYDDPVQPGRVLESVLNAEGRIVGVRSTSTAAPIARAPTDLRGESLPAALAYSQWQFLARPPR
jgi:type II secretory pathway pseudopilin PulG